MNLVGMTGVAFSAGHSPDAAITALGPVVFRAAGGGPVELADCAEQFLFSLSKWSRKRAWQNQSHDPAARGCWAAALDCCMD